MKSASLLNYFDRQNDKTHIIYKIKAEKFDDFVNALTKSFRSCYISDKKLDKRCSKVNVTKQEFFEKYVLPKDGNIKSGDFGEILCFHVVIENFGTKGFKLFGPKKWRWKDSNKAAQYTDSVLFHLSNSKSFSSKDELVTIESKMKATASTANRIQDAIDGAVDDKLSRLAKTLIWLEEKYARQGKPNKMKQVKRFSDPSTYGPYNKTHKAIAILDSTFEKEEIGKTFTNPQGVKVIVFSINDLKKVYETNITNMINSLKTVSHATK